MSNTINSSKPDFSPLEMGDYTLRMNRISEEPTKNGAGVMVKAGFEVVNGDNKGRLVFHNFLVEHTNPKAAEIGNKQLNEFLEAVGVKGGLEALGQDRSGLSDYLELPFIGALKIEEAKGYTTASGESKTSKARNKIAKFLSR